MRLGTTLAGVLMAAWFAALPATASNEEFEHALFKEAVGDASASQLSRKYVRNMLRAALDQHANRALLLSKDHSQFEAMHKKLLESRHVLPDGLPSAIAYLESTKSSLSSIAAVDDYFRQWKQADPEGALPHLLYASARLNIFAIDHRAAITLPHDFSTARMNSEEVKATRDYLTLNKHIASRHPYWYNLMVETAILTNAGGDEVKQLVRDGLAASPENVILAIHASSYFLPKWHGDGVSFESYAAWVADLPEMKARPDIYAQIFAHAAQVHYRLSLFKFAPKNWKRMKPSLVALIDNYPSERNLNTAGAIACLAGDRQLTGRIVNRNDFDLSSFFWMDEDAYPMCVNWAAAG